MFTMLQDAFEIELILSENQGRWCIFKHSDSCPISRGALVEVESFHSSHAEVPILYVEVKSQRSLSNRIADTFEVEHESPQLLLFKGKKLKESHSHGSVTKRRLSHMVSGGFHDKSST